MKSLLRILVLGMVLGVAGLAKVGAAEALWKAGVASVTLTPEEPLWMAGYAARNKPAEGKSLDLFAKALALEDDQGTRLVFVTYDLIGVPKALRLSLEERVRERYQLAPSALVITASHTHSGPEIRTARVAAYDDDKERVERSLAYYHWLEGTLADLIGRALADVAPARLSYCRARCGFAMNRRLPTERGFINSPNPDGPVDHDVPVLRVETPERQLRAVLFGYACHNTTLNGYTWSGDYAGYAQAAFEADHPGVTALFMTGCAGDQNPYPRRSPEYAERHGRTLATAIEAALEANPQTLTGSLNTRLDYVSLDYDTAPTRDELLQRAKSSNRYEKLYAELLLDHLDREGGFPKDYPYPVQVIRIADLTLVALGGEVVVDYSLRLKRELPGKTWIAAYSNDVMSYIPSKRVRNEGGYEAGESMRYYRNPVHPAWWADTLEERIITKVHELASQLGIEPVK